MENLNEMIALNLKRVREERNLSLEKVANLTGVSKSMLGQIERGESSPTVSTVWKISNGLKVPFATLMKNQEKTYEVTLKDDRECQIESDGKFRIYPIVPFEASECFEAYHVDIDEGGLLYGKPHGENAIEFISVAKGTLRLYLRDEIVDLNEGDSIRFNANINHTYENPKSTLTRLYMTVKY